MKNNLKLLIIILFSTNMSAQMTVSGIVTDETGEGLIGVNVFEESGLKGTTTDATGNFNLEVSANAIIVFSMIGFETLKFPAPPYGRLNVMMIEGVQLKEIVVTALGVERDAASLSYSVTKISAQPLTVSRENNIANGLSGQVAGVNVAGLATGPAGSSRIVIRGHHSISRDNQPLYVVDGLPIDNTNLGNANTDGGQDWGDGISSISPDDIESIQILKGANAAALYGSRAANGVILITSKKGAAGIFGVEINSNLTLEEPLVLHDWQRAYGQGWVAFKPASADDAYSSNWFHYGPKLDGEPTIQFDGIERPYEDAGDAFKQFYETGRTFTNSLALTGGAEKINFRFGFTNLENKAIIPNSGLDRRSLTLSLNAQPAKRLTASFNIRYINQEVKNRSQLAASPLNPNYSVGILPINTPYDALKGPNEDGSTLDGNEFSFVGNPYINNPFWIINHVRNKDDKNRFIGVGELKYDLNGWFYTLLRVGRDQYTIRRTEITPIGTSFLPGGGMNEANIKNTETNTDAWIGSKHIFENGFGYDIMIGGSRRDAAFELLSVSGQNFLIPDLNSITNLSNVTNNYGLWKRRSNAVFSTAQFSWKSLLYLNLTGRQEWFSTLPKDDNTLFYPSAGLSFVFSELDKMPNWLSFGKWRFSYAQVSGDVDPYSLALNYNLRASGHLGLPLGQVANTTVPDEALHPALASELETGFDLRFLNGRVGLDLSLYRQHTRKDLVVSAISNTSGFDARFVKDGEVKNLGIEVNLHLVPIKKENWLWETNLNFAKNDNEVINLGADATTIELARSSNDVPVAFIHNEVGQPASVIKGFEYKRDDAGNIIIGADGVPLQGDLVVLGNGVHDFTGGWSNTLHWKNFSFNFLLDFKTGAKVFSGSNAFATLTGRHKMTLPGREEGYISPGVTESGEPNEVLIDPLFLITYWSILPGRIAEPFVYDASYIKLRQASLTWRMPTNWLENIKLKDIEISLTGRNLLLLFSNIPNVDPESAFQNGNAQGLEMFSVPPVRTFGFNLRARI
ncbi:MAG: SusC/RagA family TonB-linked outer membrane protein [Saprospiraceae bacterium]|nr:SusC/RagA family TonB-linked outer membrane protein [Saprospiraceae bacterium]